MIIRLLEWLARRKDPAARIEYVGIDGYTQPCLRSLRRLLQAGERFERAVVVTGYEDEHAFMLLRDGEPKVIVHSGFSSKSGEGSKGFLKASETLVAFGCNITGDLQVSPDRWRRLRHAALTEEDVAAMNRPEEWSGGAGIRYYYQNSVHEPELKHVADDFEPVIPWGAVDHRLLPVARKLFDDPDSALRDGYVKLESIVAKQTGNLGLSGVGLYGKVFGKGGQLTWDGADENEVDGRCALFRGACLAYRNKLAHQVRPAGHQQDRALVLSEFMLLNHLFLLESESVEREAPTVAKVATGSP